MISAHRGLWGPAPENSLAAISAAGNYDIIEIDTQIARDGVPVVIHDPDLVRTAGKAMRPRDTDHTTLVAQYLYEGLGGPDASPTDEQLPTLSDALLAAGPRAFFDIDVKYPAEIEAVAQMLVQSEQQHMGSLKIDTKTPADIEKLLSLQQRFGVTVMAKVMLPKAGLDHISDLTKAGVAAAEVWFDDLAHLSEACRIAGNDMAISTYTLDPVHCCDLSDSRALTDPHVVWGQLLQAGVSIIMTDLAPQLATYMSAQD